MKPQHFAALAAAALGSVVLALAAYTAAAPWQAAISQGKLFPGFTDKAKNVSIIEVSQGKSLVTLERKGEIWTLKDRDGYPANSEKVRALLSGLTTAELVEPKTRKVERYTELEVEDPSGASANSHLLKLIDDKQAAVIELIVGKKSADAFGTSRAGTFVRRPGEDLTWLVDASLEAKSDIDAWVKPRIFETKSASIRKIKLEVPGEPPLDVVWDLAAKRHKLAEVPKGKRVKYANSIDEIAEALSEFDLDDVRKAGSTSSSSDPVSIANVEIDGGLNVSFKVRKEKDGDWLTLTASGNGESKKFADDLTAAVKDWEFRLPRGKADDVFKKRADLLEEDTVDTEIAPGAQKP
jgi:hypothetical protein